MPTSSRSTTSIIAAVAVGLAAVAGIIAYLQGFNAEEVACPDIAQARIDLQAAYDQGVAKSVEVYSDQKGMIDERLSACLSAKPVDPCEDAQRARDQAVEAYNGIKESSFGSFNSYFTARETAYQDYKAKKQALDACRQANPKPEGDVPYEKSDTKKCFDEYDAAVQAMRDTFEENTQKMRTALRNALAALDAREKACNPPTGTFTDPPVSTGGVTGDGSQTDGGAGSVPVELANCRPLNPNLDTELWTLRQRAGQIPAEIADVQTTIDNANERLSPLKTALSEVGTYIPPEATKTQFEGALNALRAERKVSIEAQIDFYNGLISRKQAEKQQLENELKDLNAKIAARENQIKKENEARRRAFPTNIHLSKPDECAYFHCHGTLCGKRDPAPDGCGHGPTSESDVACKAFFDSYLKAAGVY